MKTSLKNTASKNGAMETWELLARVFNLFDKQTATKIKTLGLTQPQFSIIEALGNLGSMKIGELNTNMIFNGGNMTLVLDQLEDKDYIRRTNSKTDRRAIIIELTDKGHDLFSKTYPVHSENIEELMGRLNSKEQKDLSSLLSKFFSN